ncbi:MAG TPA: TlpA disulfide reductase family protein [Cyclobacteriaceae bacterium]|jgi:peroxiredoxin|nr:TlpA disulfide reductase family protein [Cyclobacteriaceae bacterium]
MKVKICGVIISFVLTGLLLSSCKEPRLILEEGKWRGAFQAQGFEIPFNFSVEDDTIGTIKVFLTNAEEKTVLDSVRYERDSVIIPIELYDAILIGKLKPEGLSGYFRKNQSKKQGIPFTAVNGNSPRFDIKNPTAVTASVNGKWSVNLINEKNEKRYTVGLLKQEGTTITGTILTTTGDYRYLQGVVDGDSLKLSGFSGSNPSLLVAKLKDSTHLSGEFLSPGGKSKFEAVRSDTAALPDPYSLTYLNKGYDKLSFSFPDLKGKTVSLNDDKYKDKVVVVTIQGSWCPNCVDEAAFLSPWYKQNKERGVEIIGLSFERKDDPDFARKRIEKFIKRFDITYDILFAGLADKNAASEKLPELNAILSFPTTILIDRAGKVRKIHTGFTGPATGEHYQEFIHDFNADVEILLNESKGV